MAVVFKVNGVDFSDVLAMSGFEPSKEDLHGSMSGRNETTGILYHNVVRGINVLDITTVPLPEARFGEFLTAIESAGTPKNTPRVNFITYSTPQGEKTVEMYVNARKFSYLMPGWINSQTFHFAEV